MNLKPGLVALLCAGMLCPGVAAAQDEDAASETTTATPTSASPESASSSTSETVPTFDAENGGRSPIDGVVGHYGFGYFTGTAPLGVRYWFDRDSAFDLGLDIAFSSGDVEAHRYALELGYVRALAHYHYSVVFFRGGLGMRFIDSIGAQSAPAVWNANANAFFGAELFLGAFGFPNISLQGGYGLELEYAYDGGSAFVVSAVNGGLDVTGVGQVGFHIYW